MMKKKQEVRKRGRAEKKDGDTHTVYLHPKYIQILEL